MVEQAGIAEHQRTKVGSSHWEKAQQEDEEKTMVSGTVLYSTQSVSSLTMSRALCAAM